ncbi:sensor domain-containing diguanylate cyclase [Caryophanon latum]|uniref:Diguanylate cyclase n=1 Tax=Caryophanon latum TaxID=33977 RepID=A0A1C0YUI9_9BACL|nr:sensor domain-containing diguanylate cyclase [Caryophanon latum]OCS90822.1 hypothetical protein A6K76_01870 [Caryophanon latum]
MSQNIFTAKHFDMMFGNSLDYVFLMKKVGDNYQYVAINESVRQLFQQDATNLFITDLLSAETVHFMRSYYDDAVATQQQVTYQDYTHFQIAQKFETTLYPFSQHEEQYVLAITKALRYKRELADYYFFTRSLLFNSYYSTIMLSLDNVIQDFSSKVLEETGLKREELIGQSFVELTLFDEQQRHEIAHYLQQVCDNEERSSLLVQMTLPNKKQKHFLLSANIVQDNSYMDAMFVVLQDITAHHKQTEQLRLAIRDVERMQKALNSTVEIVITDIYGTIIDVNEPYCRTARYTREELICKNVSILQSRVQSMQYYEQVWHDYLIKGETWRGEVCNITKYGQPYWLDMTVLPLLNDAGEVEQFMSINLNVTEKKAIMTELNHISRMFHMITENTSDFIAIVNEDGILQYVSPSYARLLQYTQQELQGAFYSSILAEKSQSLWQNELYETLLNAGQYSMEFELVGRNGQTYFIESNISVVNDVLRPNVRQILLVSREITARKQKETELLYMAYHDALTGLPNRRFLEQQFVVAKKDALKYNESIGLLYLDGDNFKGINDGYGHDVGDQFLREFGIALRQSVRVHDIVVRVGGDEFIVLLPGLLRDKEIRREQVENVIKSIHERLRKGWYIQDAHFSPTTSIGISFFPEASMDLSRLVDAADHALLLAKQRGKNRWAYFHEVTSYVGSK